MYRKTYYESPEFMAWLVENKFKGIRDEHIAKFFSLFQKVIMCREKRCADCTRFKPVWDTQEDIEQDRVSSVRCNYKDPSSEKRRIDLLKQRVKIPRIFNNVDLDSLSITDTAKEEVEEYVKTFPNTNKIGLYVFSSEHSVGRTSVLWYIIQNLIEYGKLLAKPMFWYSRLFGETLVKDLNTDHEFIKKVMSCELLVLDDFAQGKFTDLFYDRMEYIIESRACNDKATILSSIIPIEKWAWESANEKSVLSKITKYMQIINLCTKDD